MYAYLPEIVPETSPACGAVARFIGLAGLKGLTLSAAAVPASAVDLDIQVLPYRGSRNVGK